MTLGSMMKSLSDLLTRAENSGLLVVDTETTGIDWKVDRPVGYVITAGPESADSAYFPIRHPEGNVPIEDVVPVLKRFFQSFQGVTIGHNLKFDLHMMLNDDIRVPGGVECTMVNAALIDENAGRYSLEACCERARVQAKKGKDLYEYLASLFGGDASPKQMEHFHKLRGDNQVAVEYAEGDGVSTWQLWVKQSEELARQDLGRIHKLECDLLPRLVAMERRGVRVDMERLAEVEEAVRRRREDAERAIEGINPRSTPQIKAYLEKNGITDWPTTAKGNPSFTEHYLEWSEPGQNIITARKLKTLEESFLVPLRERHLFKDRVHTNFNQLKLDDYGTVTGRLSSNEPNMQQVPKRNRAIGKLFRSVFVPDEGYVWISLDWSQCEFRLFAHYTQSETLIAGYSADPPVDIHTNVAQMLNVERDPTAKRMNLGQVYGMGVKNLAASLGIDLRLAQDYNARYHRMIPEAKPFLKKAENAAKRRGWVKTIMGRKRHFPDPTLAHKAGNSVIQGSNADAIKMKMVEAGDWLDQEGGDLLLSIHDSLDIQAPIGGEVWMAGEVVKIMEDFGPESQAPLRVPMMVEWAMGGDWAIASYGEE